jgi:hypothetical protein
MQSVVRSLLPAVVALTALAVAALPSALADGKPAETKTGSISGKVTFLGKPLPAGTVTFHPAEGKPVSVQIQEDGTYAVKDMPAGASKVTVETESVKKAKVPPGTKPKKYVAIPQKYAKPETTDLTFRVVEGKQIFNIELDR